MNPIRALLIAAACWGLGTAIAEEQVTGRVNILWDRAQTIQFVPDLKLFPGQTIDVVSSGRVDVDHQFGERRRCKWFGAKCWYEPWDRPTWMAADAMDIELQLEGAAVTSTGTTYRLEIPVSADLSNFSQGARLSGMLWKKGMQPPIQRGPCVGRPRHCSQGDLTITFASVNSTVRLNALEAILANQRIQSFNVQATTSTDYIDPLLAHPQIAKASTILRLSSILAKAAARFRDSIPDKSSIASAPLHLKVIDLASYALRLSHVTVQDSAQLRTLIAESYLDRQDYQGAGQAAPKMMADAEAAFKKNPDGQSALQYAKSLKVNAAVWREQKARNSSADILVGIAMLDKATDLLWAYTDYPGATKVMADINVDAARMLNLLRTEPELKAAEDRMVAAICFQMHGEKADGTSFDSWRSGATDPTLADCQSVRKVDS